MEGKPKKKQPKKHVGNLQNDKCLFLVRDPSGNATRGKTPPASAMHSAACRHIHDASVDSEPMLALTFSPSTGEAGGGGGGGLLKN